MLPKRKFLFCWLVAGLLESPFLIFILEGSASWLEGKAPLAFAMHALASFVAGTGGIKNPGGLRANPWGFGLFLFVFSFPLFGWLGALAFLFYRDPEPAQILEAEQEAPLLIEQSRLNTPKAVVILRELDFIPLADILRGQDDDLKRGAIERLANFRTPEAIGLLLACRSDASIEVRFHVTSALTRIRKDFDEQLEAARARLGDEAFNLNARLTLVRKYLQYADSRLLDEATLKAYRNEALHHLEAAIASGEAPLEAYRLLVEACEAENDWPRALAALKELEGAASGSETNEIARHRAGLYFRAGRYADMLAEMGRAANGTPDPQWSSLVQWWGGAR